MKKHHQAPVSAPPPLRTFSAEFKRAIVQDIENKLLRIQHVADEYEVSRTSIYRWMRTYGTATASPRVRLVLEHDSEHYQSKQLRQRLLELEATIGRKQLHIDYLNELIATSSDALGIDLKKTFASTPSAGSEDQIQRRIGA